MPTRLLQSVKHATPEEAMQLLHVIECIHPVSEPIKKYLINHSYPCRVKKGKRLVKTGEICKNIYFIKKGVIRGYVKDKKQDITTWITAENEMATAISSFNFQEPALENIQAIEDCELLTMSFEDLQNLYLTYPDYNIVGRKVYEQYYADAEIRALIGRVSNAEKKYAYFFKVYNKLANRIPVKYIASYLGIRQETLSRVRRKASNIEKSI